ncbi:MAG TPA: WGR domain-containing protein [Chloroflexota bacterium]
MKAATLDRAVEYAQPSAPAKPGADRLPFQKKVNLLSDRGLWPQLEALAKQHGWHSENMRAFIDANLPKAPCPICSTEFYVYSKRVKYCSDRCRRVAAAGNERIRDGAAAPAPAMRTEVAEKPKGQNNGDLCVRLERLGDDPLDRRFYILMVVQDLFGAVALVRRWGRDERERSQQTVTSFLSLDQALEQLERHKATCLKRGYHLVAVERGRVDPRTLS